MLQRTPTFDQTLERKFASFDTLPQALDYAAKGTRGINIYDAKGNLVDVSTYTALRERALKIAAQLFAAGLTAGDRVALIAETSSDFVAAFLGAQYASILPVPLPLPTSFGGREGYVDQLHRQMESCGARAVIGPEGMDELLRDAVVGLDMVFCGTNEEFAELPAPQTTFDTPHTEQVAYLQYSSGSTRFPHGVMVTHKAVMSNCHGQGYHGVQLRPTDRIVSWLPFYHDMGLVGMLLTCLTCQVSADFIATESFTRRPMQWLRLISENEDTSVSYSPTFGYDICARRANESMVESLDLSRWRVAGNGGDMIRPEVMQLFTDKFGKAGFDAAAFMPSYGLAECVLAVSFMPAGRGIMCDMVEEDALTGEPISHGGHKPAAMKLTNGSNGHANGSQRFRAVVNCGVPLPDLEVEIRSSNDDAMDEKEIGRVLVRGPAVMRGYFNDEESTRAVLSPDGWLDTGDMGYLMDGCLYVVGRIKDMIIVNGRNHWPQDIEWAVEQLPGLRSGDIAAISLTNERGEEVPAVLVQCRPSDPESQEQLRSQVRRKVQSETGIAVQVELVPPRTLPRTSSGKLSRSKARDRFISGGIVPLAAAG
ncbi:MAG: fatty acyl-AMP ligase [Pseudomonadota bacterium]